MLDFNGSTPAELPKPDGAREELRTALLARLEDVLRHLFPAGEVKRGNFLIGDVLGSPGHSLEIVLDGDKAGLWTDRATGEGGDTFDLIARYFRLDVRGEFPRVMEEAARLSGCPTTAPFRKKGKKEVLVDELGPATAKWDYQAADGSLIGCVYRYDPPGERKEFRPWDAKRRKMAPPDPRPLYNQPGMAAVDTVVLVEGEKCAQALIDIGIVATTAMNGAHAPIDKTDWTPLAGKHVLIWPDRDKAGWDYALNASDAIMAADAASCTLLMPPANPSPEHPEGQPDGWDAADAVSEGFDVGEFLTSGERIACHAPGGSEDVDIPAEQAVWATEDALALTFTRRYADDWRYVAAWGKWVVWTGKRWQTEQTLAAQHLMRQVCREASLKADSHRIASRLASSGTVSGLERLARSDRRHAATADEWDSDFWLLNTPGGVVDLKTGRLRPHDRIDRMTKITTATPQGNCPIWLNFVHEVTGGDFKLQSYLARVAGYALTGITSEHALFFLYGTGANGKSVFVNALATILGDYATNAAMDTFMESRADRHPTDMAALRGARFVSSIETEQGKRWAESKLKALTGGDRISARFMRQDFFEFMPQFKLLVAGNHKPAIRNIDEAMKRRLHLIPFTVTIPPERRDKLLQQKLLAEGDGILAWAVRGCLEWQRNGLKPPQRVLEATDEYFEGEDALGRWMEERCFVEKTARALTSDLFADWKEWAEQSGEFAGSIRRFSDLLVTRHFQRCRAHGGGRGFEGIGLRPRAFKSYTDFND
jgi:putative DNA primase/helicase